MNSFVFLIVSIVFEVFATSALKMSEGFTKVWPTFCVILGYGVAFYFLSLSTKQLPLSFVYAAWSGLGTILISLVGYFYFKETFDILKIIGLFLIILGVVFMKYSNVQLK
ncbi:QacE family quaternary ammonium compound efflux SMR transporter [Silvanigrella aquatica]|uniref:QacE family quaternary ammonium compound efflux SMR transporter n=2 Tax=Silvanigrella aquatica TaxID=1915309 RepID=A0A1L4CZL9_9BACT|nr:QacE family quaternary ammonium compound efflux SMR transporter [Silvanigrella aquatica]